MSVPAWVPTTALHPSVSVLPRSRDGERFCRGGTASAELLARVGIGFDHPLRHARSGIGVGASAVLPLTLHNVPRLLDPTGGTGEPLDVASAEMD